MSDNEPVDISEEQREFSRRRFLRLAGATAAGASLYGGLAGILGEQGASAATYKRNSDKAVFASHPKYHFVMVNHVTTNSFFTATIYGIQDACALTGCTLPVDGLGDLDRHPDGRRRSTPRSPARRRASGAV